jgi:hypothetical protein
MSDQPRYVDDPFEDEGPDVSTSGIENIEVLEKAQRVCRRWANPFHKTAEKRKWLTIDKKITKGKIGEPWLEHCFTWAKGKNQERLVIKLPALASYINNTVAMSDWLQGQAKEQGVATQDERDLSQEGF